MEVNQIYSTRAVYVILGSLCNDTEILRDTSIYLDEDDFVDDAHKIIFNAIDKISLNNKNIKQISEIDIDNYLASQPSLYEIWENEKGLEYVNDARQFSNVNTFEDNYNTLKKLSLLRSYENNGMSVKDIYDCTTCDALQQTKQVQDLEKLSIEDIMEHMTLKNMEVRDNFNIGLELQDFKAGDGLDTLLSDLKLEPEFGYPFQNRIYNSVFRGMRPKKFMLRSADTGCGKTRTALADICNVSIDEIYDIDNDIWIPNGTRHPSIYISTELEKRDVQTIMLAFISGVNEEVIKDGKYSEPVHQRLLKSIEILKRAPIYCVYIDDFSIADIELTIEKHIIKYDIRYVAFDYIQITPKLMRSMSKMFGGQLREDQVLVQFSSALKILTNRYGTFLLSSTQLNRNSKDITLRDTNSLRGGSAVADKIDHGVMTFKATAADLTKLKAAMASLGFDNVKEPNYSHWVYKNRSGRNNLIIWTNLDLGTMREISLFVTDYDYNLITDIKEIEIEKIEDFKYKSEILPNSEAKDELLTVENEEKLSNRIEEELIETEKAKNKEEEIFEKSVNIGADICPVF